MMVIVTSVAPMLVDKATSLLAHIFPARRAHVARVTDGCPGGAQKRRAREPATTFSFAARSGGRLDKNTTNFLLSRQVALLQYRRSFSTLSVHALLKSALHDSLHNLALHDSLHNLAMHDFHHNLALHDSLHIRLRRLCMLPFAAGFSCFSCNLFVMLPMQF